jgi:hypothetical protein
MGTQQGEMRSSKESVVKGLIEGDVQEFVGDYRDDQSGITEASLKA